MYVSVYCYTLQLQCCTCEQNIDLRMRRHIVLILKKIKEFKLKIIVTTTLK